MNGSNNEYPQNHNYNAYAPQGGYPQSRLGMPMPGQAPMPSSQSAYNMSTPGGPRGPPTPTLNQLLQTPNPAQRHHQPAYSDYGAAKANVMGGNAGFMPNPNWSHQQRQMNPYQQQQMHPSVSYRNQVRNFLIQFEMVCLI